jgi:uncharacterized protein (DUF1697 family)
MILVALLRGVNVGGKARVEMARLKQVVEELGAADVSTYINSGNVIFRDRRAARTLVPLVERAILDAFAVESRVVVRDLPSMERLLEAIPATWTNDDAQKTDVLFLRPEIDRADLLDDVEVDPKIENVLHAEGAIVWNIARRHATRGNGIKLVRSDLYASMTVRNVNTVRKLHELMTVAAAGR